MLGVLKRRWKPKRASNGGTRYSNEINPLFEQEKPRLAPSVRQVHPVCDEKKAQLLAYDAASSILPASDGANYPSKIQQQQQRPHLIDDLNASPPPYPKRASLDSNPSPTAAYPLAPNICVEAGRIEFIKLSPDGATDGVATPTPTTIANATTNNATNCTNNGNSSSTTTTTIIDQQQLITVTRSCQTDADGVVTEDAVDEEKYEREKEDLRSRIAELETALDDAQEVERRDKQSLSKLNKQLSRLREAAQRDADREKRLRADSEARAKQALQEAARCRSRLKLLTHEFSRMEETVRSMLVYKNRAEQLRQEKAALTVAFESRCQQYQSTIGRLNQEVTSLRQQLDQVSSEPGVREGVLQAHSVALHRQAEESRKQYERCLDDVANQVVKALLAQKGLREEIANLHKRIQELESQNKALTSMLVHQLRNGGDSTTIASVSDLDLSAGSVTNHLALEDLEDNQRSTPREITDKDAIIDTTRRFDDIDLSNNTSADVSPSNLLKTSINVKHCNSFDSDVLAVNDQRRSTDNSTNEQLQVPSPDTSAVTATTALTRAERHLSADSSKLVDKQLSLEDKKRHQVLTKLWTDLKGAEVTPKRLIEALSAIDPALWVPPQRPVSLNLQLPILPGTKYRCRNRSILVQASSKSEEETTGNESPESSGNRDEGYSTMSSDVQAELSKASGECAVGTVATRGLEDLKEATDEGGGCGEITTGGSTVTSTETRLLLAENNDPDVLYIPLNLLSGVNPRNSYPPTKDILPFQHIMRSFSDSHLCIKITASPSPCYSLSSPISSTPSILFLDITDKKMNPLRRVKAAASLLSNGVPTCEDHHHRYIHQQNGTNGANVASPSWSSPSDECLRCTALDAEYIQHWLRLDETRSALQQHHRDMLELEYDRAELEDWSLSLSSDDLRGENNATHKRASEVTTPGQISISTTLPSIQEHNALELEEDSNECLWNNSSYMMDREGHELVALLMDTNDCQIEKQWPYAIQNALNANNHSPDNSWSSNGSDCCNSYEPETFSKRSSAALSGCSDDTGELPAIGTDFTRDFYRLVKFESTKSLASTSSRSLGGALSENGDREMALQNVLTFIAEQQKYAHNRGNISDVNSKELVHPVADLTNLIDDANCQQTKDENYVTLKQLATEYTLNEQNANKDVIDVVANISYAEEVCLVTPLDVESENCSNIVERPVDICSSAVESAELGPTLGDVSLESQQEAEDDTQNDDETIEVFDDCDELTKSGDTLSNSDIMNASTMSESVTSSTSTPDTVVCSKIPRLRASKIPVSPCKTAKTSSTGAPQEAQPSKLPKSKTKKAASKISRPVPAAIQKHKIVHQAAPGGPPQHHVITSERLPQFSAGVISNIIDGPPHRAVSFHERATSKDVIDELNRMIQKGGDETTTNSNGVQERPNEDATAPANRLDEACRPTGWIHVERDIDLTDPKARANLLDVMMASVSSDSSPTSSCGGSITSDSTEEVSDYRQLHRIHKYHRQKKVNMVRPELAVVRAVAPQSRPSIIGRPNFFMRYGEKEREAVASFDFLDELSTSSSSVSIDESNGEDKGAILLGHHQHRQRRYVETTPN